MRLSISITCPKMSLSDKDGSYTVTPMPRSWRHMKSWVLSITSQTAIRFYNSKYLMLDKNQKKIVFELFAILVWFSALHICM